MKSKTDIIKLYQIITDFENAEVVFRFVNDNPDILSDFYEKRSVKALSYAEYVFLFKGEDFLEYLKNFKKGAN